MNIETVRSIEYHYEHAKKKHPHFCDGLLPTEVPDPYFPKTKAMERDEIMAQIASKLSSRRNRIEAGNKYHNLLWNEILDCEVWEITEAMANGDTEHAVEECYDAIAVLLRTIDVIMGHQELGNPKEEGVAK